MLGEKAREHVFLARRGVAAQHLLPQPVDPLLIAAFGFRQHPRGQHAAGFYVGRIVQQHQRAARCVAHRPFGGALLPAGGVEGQQRRV